MAAAEAAMRLLSQCGGGQMSEDKLTAADLACKRLFKAVAAMEEEGPSVPDWLRPTPSLLATLVAHKSVSALRLIGALALQSLASNRALAQQEGLIHTLVACLADAGSDKVLEACANALSDLATSDEGSAALVAQGALPVLLDLLIELAPTLAPGPRKRKRTASDSPAALSSLLDAVFSLLFCKAAPAIGELPRGRPSLALEALSSATRDASLEGELSPKQTARFCALAVRLSLEGAAADSTSGSDVTASAEADSAAIGEARSSFGKLVGFGAAGFGDFLRMAWEQRPVFFPASESKASATGGGGSLWPLYGVKGLRSLGDFFQFLEWAVGCPSPAADECDVIMSLWEASEELGGPLVYGRDVTLVKTVEGRLVHFDGEKGRSGLASEASSEASPGSVDSARTDFDGPGGSLPVIENPLANPRFVSAGDCREAFRNGFSVAVRGLQCRIPEVAKLAGNVALALGQAGVGVNAYVTPSNSQGLAAHYDDHCVFVCQLAGSKHWRVYEPLESELMPRLYAPRAEPELAGRVCGEFKMRKGDVLYIPRGWTHVATALGEESLHVTFGVEVEEPFSWEGFLKAAVQAAKDPVDRSASPTRVPPVSPSESSFEVPSKSSFWGREPVGLPSVAESGGGLLQRRSECSASDSKPEEPLPSCRCYEAVEILADSIPELRQACLLGAVHGSGSPPPSTSDEPERNGIPTEVTKAAQRSALRVAELPGPSHVDGFGGSSVDRTGGPWKGLTGKPLGKPNMIHTVVFDGRLDGTVSQTGAEAASSSTALGDGILTEAAFAREYSMLLGRVRAQALMGEGYVDRRPGVDSLEAATLPGQEGGSPVSSSGSDGQATARGRVGVCSGCVEAAPFGTGKRRYLQLLREYQTARRRWNEAMLAVQSFMKNYQ